MILRRSDDVGSRLHGYDIRKDLIDWISVPRIKYGAGFDS